MTHLSWAGSCMWENFASQAGKGLISNHSHPRNRLASVDPNFPFPAMSRHVLVKEESGLSSGTIWQSNYQDETPTNPFPTVPHLDNRTWGHDTLSLTIQNSGLVTLGIRKVFEIPGEESLTGKL